MTPLARLLVRPTEDGRGDLILGVMFKKQVPDLLRPGLVYEVREVLGAAAIVSLGEAAIGRDAGASLIPGIHWLGTPDQILTTRYWPLTRSEYLSAKEIWGEHG